MAVFAFAIGVFAEIAFASWAWFFLRAHRAAPGLSPSTAELKRAQALQQVQWASLYARSLELFSFLALIFANPGASTGDGTRARALIVPVGAYLLFTITHGRIRFALERELRGIELGHLEALGRSSRSVIGMVALFSAYFGVYQCSMLALRLAADRLLPPGAAALSLWVNFPLSLLLGLATVYFLSPVLVRLMFPCRPLEDPGLIATLERCFSRAGLARPSFWILDIDRAKAHNAMVAGLRSGRGPFRPALFFTRSLTEQLTPQEFEGVILHEVSHIALKHMFRRLLWSVAALFIAFACSSFVIFLTWEVVGRDFRTGLSFAALAFSFWIQVVVLRWQVRKQELEADAHAVFAFGADLEAFASALTKITKMNDHSTTRRDPSSYFNPAAAHPATDERIAALRRRAGTLPETPSKQDQAA